MADAKTVLFEVSDGVAHITLNRPDAFNAIEPGLLATIGEHIITCERDRAVRAVLFDGAGPNFGGGGDLKFFASRGDSISADIRELAHSFHTAVGRLVRLEKPVVCAVQGAAAGGGLSWMLASDLVLAGESAKFKVAYSAIGYTMDGGSTFFLPRLIGLRRAMELALTNRTLSAAEALDYGLVTEVVPDLELADRAAKLAAQMASGPTWALGRIKRLLHDSWTTSLESQLEAETTSISEAAGRGDGREGLAAFVEKRRPTFTGE